MNKYQEIIVNSYSDHFNYLKNELVNLHVENYFYGLIIISLIPYLLKIYKIKCLE